MGYTLGKGQPTPIENLDKNVGSGTFRYDDLSPLLN